MREVMNDSGEEWKAKLSEMVPIMVTSPCGSCGSVFGGAGDAMSHNKFTVPLLYEVDG